MPELEEMKKLFQEEMDKIREMVCETVHEEKVYALNVGRIETLQWAITWIDDYLRGEEE